MKAKLRTWFAFLACTLGVAGLGQASVAHARACGHDAYTNTRGNCVHRPIRSNRAPSGASARCRDGTFSFSQSRRGTCSHHGGVSQWL